MIVSTLHDRLTYQTVLKINETVLKQSETFMNGEALQRSRNGHAKQTQTQKLEEQYAKY
jgi:hypothetical protein